MGLAAIKTNQLIAGEIAQSGGVENYLKTQGRGCMHRGLPSFTGDSGSDPQMSK